MNNNGKSALLQAMEGKDLSERQSQSALGEAMKQITSLTKRVSTNKETLAETGTNLAHSAETMGTVFMASMAEGYFGSEKLKVGGVDLRAPLGLAAQGYGLYEIMNGRDSGGHALAMGNGLTGSWLAQLGRQAGEAVRESGEKKAKGKTETPTAAPPQGQGQGQPQAQTQPQGAPAPAPAQEPATGARLLPAPPAEDVGAWPRAAQERVHVERRPVREVLLTPPSRRAGPGADPFEAQPPRQRGGRREAEPPQPDEGRGQQEHGRAGRYVRAGSDKR